MKPDLKAIRERAEKIERILANVKCDSSIFCFFHYIIPDLLAYIEELEADNDLLRASLAEYQNADECQVSASMDLMRQRIKELESRIEKYKDLEAVARGVINVHIGFVLDDLAETLADLDKEADNGKA